MGVFIATIAGIAVQEAGLWRTTSVGVIFPDTCVCLLWMLFILG